MKFLRAACLFLLALCSAPSSATIYPILSQPLTGNTGTVVEEAQIPVVGSSPTTYWPQRMLIVIPQGGAPTTAVISAHGGGGSNVENCLNYSLCKNTQQTWAVSAGSWSASPGAGTATFTVGTDPTAIIIPGHSVTISGSGNTGYNGSFTAVSATWDSGSSTGTVAVSMAGANPGTFTGAATLSSLHITALSINWATPNNYNTLFAFPQGQFPNGTDTACNNPTVTATIDDGAGHPGNILTVTAISAGIALSKNQVVSGTGVAGGTSITGYGTSNGYSTGTATVSGAPQLVGSETMTLTGNSYAPNATSWCNGMMNTGQNDLQFFSDAKAYLHTTYGVSNNRFGFIGHSNGGMMGERVLKENTGLFAWYALLAGPQSTVYNYRDITPSTYAVKVMWIWGDLDDVICNAGYMAGCTNTPIVFTGYQSGTTLHVTSVATGTLQIGVNVVDAGGNVPAGEYLTVKQSTAVGDVSTWTTSVSATVSSESMNASNTFDAQTSQNKANATLGYDVYPLPMPYNGITTTMAYWAANQCAPASLSGRSTVNPADFTPVVVSLGVGRSVSYCTGNLIGYEFSNSGHPISQIRAAWGKNPMVQFVLQIQTWN